MEGRLKEAPSEALTRAEVVVLREAMSGDSVKEIAHRLSLSPATVRSHLSSIYAKLNVDGRAQLIARYAADTSLPQGTSTERPNRVARRRLVVAGAAALVGMTVLVALVALLQPRSLTMAELTSLAERGEVSSLRHLGTTLIASTAAGDVKVPNASVESANRLAQTHQIDLDIAAYEPSWLEVPILAAPFAALGAALLAFAWLVLRSFDGRSRRHSPSE